MLFYPRKSSFVVIQPAADSTLWPLLYLSSFSILFGAQMWMTFVSGTTLAAIEFSRLLLGEFAALFARLPEI
jgi:hypothetical protein